MLQVDAIESSILLSYYILCLSVNGLDIDQLDTSKYGLPTEQEINQVCEDVFTDVATNISTLLSQLVTADQVKLKQLTGCATKTQVVLNVLGDLRAHLGSRNWWAARPWISPGRSSAGRVPGMDLVEQSSLAGHRTPLERAQVVGSRHSICTLLHEE